MPQTHKVSFLITLALLFFLPIFFIPGGALTLDVAKSALFSLGIIAAVLIFLFEVWREGSVTFSKHYFLIIVAILPPVYLLSALLSTPSSLSLSGYNFEVGTFGYMLLGSVVLILTAIIFSNTSRVLHALVAFFISLSIVALFVAIKIIFGGDILVWGNFFGNMANPIGNWTDLGVSLGLLSVFTVLALGMIPMKFYARVLVYSVFILGTALLIIVNFFPSLVLTLVASIFLFLYFSRVEKVKFSGSTFLPIALGIVSLVFLVNPTISSTRGTLSDVISSTFKIDNVDVRPSLSATLSISKEVLSRGGLLGSGPNTFGRDWLIHKPVNVNNTPFWAVAFPFGVGFIPTQIATTGLLGSLVWIVFFVLLLSIGARVLNRIPESRDERFVLVSTLLITILLWVSSFLYTPSSTVLMLTFIFTGLFVAVSAKMGIISSRSISLKGSKQNRFISIALIVVIALGALCFGRVGFNNTVSAFYFKKAVDLSNTAGASIVEIEKRIEQAISFSQLDMYYVGLSRINFVKAQAVADAATGTPQENQALFQESLRKSIEAAKLAITSNSASYQNWVSLGIIYSALVPKPLSVVGAYENALFAYSEASKRNPNNPELPLLLARLEFNKGNIEEARSFIRSSIALKEDYADAYLLLARLEIEVGNTAGAIASTERLALLVPNNSGVYFELGLLKYSSADYAGAVEAFKSALLSTPDYANAKYYLGLTLSRLGRLDEARVQFEELLVTNPDNEDLKAILKGLNDN